MTDLRKLVEKMRNDDDRNDILLEYADELEAAIAPMYHPDVCGCCNRCWCEGVDRARQLAEEAAIAEAPEQAARRRLGEWLAAGEGRYYEDFGTDTEPPGRVALETVFDDDTHGSFPSVDVDAPTWTEAVNAALDRVEGKTDV